MAGQDVARVACKEVDLVRFRNISGTAIPADQEAADFMDKLSPGHIFGMRPVDIEPGSVNMLRTWRLWMSETAVLMRHHGCSMPLYIDAQGNPKGKRQYSADDAHEQFTSIYLGVDEKGTRKTWTLSKSDSGSIQASVGDRLHAMDVHLAWCTDKGWKLTIPHNSEYRKLKQEQGEARA